MTSRVVFAVSLPICFCRLPVRRELSTHESHIRSFFLIFLFALWYNSKRGYLRFGCGTIGVRLWSRPLVRVRERMLNLLREAGNRLSFWTQD